MHPKIQNWIQTILLILGMSSLLALSSYLLFGPQVWIWVFLAIVLVMLTLPRFTPYWILKFYQAKLISFQQSPVLFNIINELSLKAKLPDTPLLFWIPSQTLNAFAVGSRNHSAIAITDGLLRLLSSREMTGVLAHEISHIRNNDIRIMTLADLITRLTHTLSLTGILIILICIPLILLGQLTISITGLLILVLAPVINALLQLGLSRIREFNADIEAARLTGDPVGLASALSKIYNRQSSPWQQILVPGYRNHQPSILRSHPETDERVKRLLEWQHSQQKKLDVLQNSAEEILLNPFHKVAVRKPKHDFFSGIWR